MTREEMLQHMKNMSYFFSADALEMAIDELKKPTTEEVLNKIRAEIQKVIDAEQEFKSENAKAQTIALYYCIDIIDKYREVD